MLLRKVRSFLKQPLFIQIWFLPIWFLLGISKTLIFTIHFRRLARCLGKTSNIDPWVPLVTAQQNMRALYIGRAIRMTAQYTPWNSNCFPQAVVARILLGLYGIPYALYFGLQKDPQKGEVNAHAWVVSGPIRVTGGASFGQFTVVGCFASEQFADYA